MFLLVVAYLSPGPLWCSSWSWTLYFILLLTLTKMLKMQTHLDGHFSSEVVEDCFGFLLAELHTGRILR